MSRRDAGMRADLHVHSRHSGRASLPLLGRVAQECYAEPRAVYEQALRRGMDLVTLTDHDGIDGALDIAALPGTFMGEEVTCELPGGRELHLGVFDFQERQHAEIQRRRHDAEALFAYLAEQHLPVVANHLFSALTGRREVADLHLALRHATHVEALNGALPASSNAWARGAALEARRPMVGGSDAHTLRGVATAWTIVPGAGTRDDFLEGLREGRTIPERALGNLRALDPRHRGPRGVLLRRRAPHGRGAGRGTPHARHRGRGAGPSRASPDHRRRVRGEILFGHRYGGAFASRRAHRERGTRRPPHHSLPAVSASGQAA